MDIEVKLTLDIIYIQESINKLRTIKRHCKIIPWYEAAMNNKFNELMLLESAGF